VQTARGVDQHEVRADLTGARKGVEHDGCGVGAALPLDHGDARSRRPDRELLDGGRAVGVGRSHDDPASRSRRFGGDLAHGGGLPGPVDTHEEDGDGTHLQRVERIGQSIGDGLGDGVQHASSIRKVLAP
jgi:hypothetical protein